MKNLKKKRRIQIIIAASIALLLAVGLIGFGFRDGINLYRSPSEFAENPPAAGEIFRLGGLVAQGSLVRGSGETITFDVTDGAATIPVRFTGVLPDLFNEGEGTIATGRMEGDVFVATDVLAKHDEKYVPKEVIDTLKKQGIYEDPNS